MIKMNEKEEKYKEKLAQNLIEAIRKAEIRSLSYQKIEEIDSKIENFIAILCIAENAYDENFYEIFEFDAKHELKLSAFDNSKMLFSESERIDDIEDFDCCFEIIKKLQKKQIAHYQKS